MGFRVRLYPSGREFMAEPQETLLEAALRSGVNIHYNCSNGSCGECRARIIEGRGEDREFHDYILSENERNNGVVLLCTTHAASDLVLEARVVESVDELPHQKITAKIFKVEKLDDSVVMLLLRTPRTKTLRFLAGQHVQLNVAGHGVDLPIASCPCNGMMLQFHLQRGNDEPLASWLIAQPRFNESVQIEGPFGNFVLNEASSHDVVMVGEETGFASLKGLIEHFFNLEKPQPLHLYRVAHHVQGNYLDKLCESWRDAIDNFTYTPLVVASPAAMLELLQHIARQIRHPAQTDVYLAISQEIAEAGQQIFTQCGVPPQQIAVAQHRTVLREAPLPGTVGR